MILAHPKRGLLEFLFCCAISGTCGMTAGHVTGHVLSLGCGVKGTWMSLTPNAGLEPLSFLPRCDDDTPTLVEYRAHYHDFAADWMWRKHVNDMLQKSSWNRDWHGLKSEKRMRPFSLQVSLDLGLILFCVCVYETVYGLCNHVSLCNGHNTRWHKLVILFLESKLVNAWNMTLFVAHRRLITLELFTRCAYLVTMCTHKASRAALPNLKKPLVSSTRSSLHSIDKQIQGIHCLNSQLICEVKARTSHKHSKRRRE